VEILIMNRFLTNLFSLFLLVWACSLARGQTLVDLRTQSKSVDFTGANSTKPYKSGSSLPLTCGVGEAFFNTSAAAGKNLYICTAPNVWTLQNGSSLPDPTSNANTVLSNDGANPGWRPLSGDVSGPPQYLRVSGLQGRIVSSAAPGDGQVLRWNSAAQDWEPGTAGSGGVPAGVSNYARSFSAATSVSILGTNHKLGTTNLIVECYDTTLALSTRIEPDAVTVNPATFDVAVTFIQPQTGSCVVNGSGGGTPVSLAGDLTGTSTSAIVTGIQNFPVSSVAPTDGEVLTWSSAVQHWLASPPQSGQGVSGSSTLNSLAVSYQTPTTLIVGSTCSSTLPCNARIGSTVFSFASSATVTVQGGSGSIYIFVANNGIVMAASTAVTVACSAGCVALNGLGGFPPNSIPLATWTASNGVLDITGGHDNRAFLSTKSLASGTGILVLDSGTQTTVSVNAALVPTYLAASGRLTFPSIDTFTCSSEQTISMMGANPGDSVAPGWPPSLPQGVLGMMRVSASGIIAVRLCNFSGAALTPQVDTFRATVVRSL
jgi:hypothetical protein